MHKLLKIESVRAFTFYSRDPSSISGEETFSSVTYNCSTFLTKFSDINTVENVKFIKHFRYCITI